MRRRAARLGRDPEVLTIVARTYLTESTAVFDMTGDLDAALELVDIAATVARQLGSGSLLATVLAQRAFVILRSGDTRAALAAFDEVAALLDDMESSDRAIVMLNRGALRLEHSDLQQAQDDLARSVAYAVDAGDAALESSARHNLGYVDFLAGRIPRAITAYRQAATTWPGAPHPVMQLDLARGLREAGLVGDADETLVQAASRARELRLFQDLGEIELVRAECALASDDTGRARRHATLGAPAVRAARERPVAAQGRDAGAAQRPRGPR